jgi:U3 small nucleolar ribonucleoprotein protein IMP4
MLPLFCYLTSVCSHMNHELPSTFFSFILVVDSYLCIFLPVPLPLPQVNETRGMPDALIISHLPYGPTAYFTLSNCVLRHDIAECKPASQAYPHLIIDGLNSKIGKRIGRILQSLFPIPRAESKRVLTFANRNDFIFFRHHMYMKEAGKVVLSEAGPRFEMQPYEGT